MKSELSVDYLREMLDYDPESGIFRWKFKTPYKDVGEVVGRRDKDGYLDTHIKMMSGRSKNFRLHRLAWFYVYGVWPENQIDHINGIKDDNRIENLREATANQNQWNQKKAKNNTSGHKVVYWVKRANKWRAFIYCNSKNIHLGYFSSLLEAAEAYKQAAIKYHGEFANYED